MKLIHTSDLHIGKRVNEYSMLDDQEYILEKIIAAIESESADGLIIAGDVYDKSMPSAEAVALFDGFLTRLSKMGIKVFIISGNHDSPERVAYGSEIFSESGIHVSPVYCGRVDPIILSDEWGEVAIYLLPFVKPQHVARYSETEISSPTDAMRVAVEEMNINAERRNILVTHQFVTGASRTDSEDVSVGGCDNVDACVFTPFDYTALGHIHRAQSMTAENIRYSGTPLKYSFSEANDKKSLSVIELSEKGSVKISEIPLIPKRDMKELKGSYAELMSREFYEGTSYRDDYIHITLTDEDDVPDAAARLRVIYRNLMRLDYDNTRTRSIGDIGDCCAASVKSPIEIFDEFYSKQNGQPMTAEQRLLVENLIDAVWNG